MEPVKELVKKAIPSLSSDKMDALMARLVELGVQCEDDMILVEPRTFRTLCHSFSAEDSLKLSKEIHKLHHSSEALALHLHLCHRVMICPQHHLRHYLPIPHLPTPHPVSHIPYHGTKCPQSSWMWEKKWVKSKERLQMVRIVVDDYLHKHPGRPGRSKLMEIAKNIESSVRKLMAETYPIQRETINDGTNVKVLKEEWPFLFEAAHLFDHASRLLGFSVQNKLAQELSKKEPGINNFLDTKGMKMGEGPVQLICGIVRYFKENPDHLFCKNEDSADAELSLPCTPCILIRGDHLFEIAVDQEVVNDHITSPIVALSYAFCLFYVCNIEYPKEMSLTLEFMQR
ncbi:hypothetical protein NQZ68_036212 [Dissostichus eleginoides]|nr:hypothetical protein NQZ68_036212 [Dissostichus eleginoides]